MEIAKFVLSCVGTFITTFLFFAGFWKAYKKRVEDKIKQVQEEANKKIEKQQNDADEKIANMQEVSNEKTVGADK